MITLHGVLFMIFRGSKNKLFFGFFSFVFLIGCGLQIGEDPPPIPTYKVQMNSEKAICSSLDYKKELKDYFFKPHSLNSSKIDQILKCISSQVSSMRSLIHNEYLTRGHIIGVLDEGLVDNFIDIESLKPFLKDILQSKKYKEETFFVKNFVENYLINPNSHVDSEDLCRLSESIQTDSKDVISELQVGEKLISKSDVDIILRFLDSLSKFLSDIEKKSNDFFKSFGKNKLNDKKDLINNQKSFLEFADFFKKTMRVSFNDYYKFLLKSQLELDYISSDYYNSQLYALRKRELDFIIQYLLSSEKKEITLLDIKYIFIMIDFMKFFFQFHDFNQDFIIDSQELKPLSCLLSAAVFIFAKDQIPAEDRDKQVEYSEVIARYILNNQEIPEGFLEQMEIAIRAEPVSWFLGAKFESVVKDFFSKDVKDLSFREASRLIFLFFNLSMKKIKELDGPPLNGGENKEKKDK